MSKKIRLNATEDVKEFVKAASKCDFDVDISYNRILIDAKSILGILSMDLTRVLNDNSRLSENTEDPRKFNIPWVFSFCQNLRICV